MATTPSKNGGLLGILQEKIIYYPSLHCQPQWAWKSSPLCLLDAILHHNENHSLKKKKKKISIFSKLLTLFHLLFHWPVLPHILPVVSSSSTIPRHKVSSEALLIYTLPPPSLSASYIQPWPLSCCSFWSSPDHSPSFSHCKLSLYTSMYLDIPQSPQNSTCPRANLPQTCSSSCILHFHSQHHLPQLLSQSQEFCLKLTDTHFIIFTS